MRIFLAIAFLKSIIKISGALFASTRVEIQIEIFRRFSEIFFTNARIAKCFISV